MSYLGKGLKSVSSANITVDTMVGDDVVNTLALSQNGVESVKDVSVYYQGVAQVPNVDYTLTASTVTFTTIPASGMKVVAVTKGDSIRDKVNDSSASGTSFADNSITDSNVIGLDASKLTGALPAMDGSALTNTSLPTAPLTSSASDPATDTNGTLGDIFVNTTTGQMFVLTDATTDENIWTNAGNGDGHIVYTPPVAYGYQGTQNVYSSGGYIGPTFNNIETHTIQSDGNSISVGTLTVARGTACGNSSTTHGHMAGGVGWPYLSVIDKFSFASGADAVTHADMASPGGYWTGWTDWDVAGYVVGGRDADSNGNNGVDVNKIRKYSFSSSATSVETGDTMLTTAAYWGCGGTTDRVNGYGYGAGDTGSSAPYTGQSTRIQRYAFNSSSNSVDVGNLTWESRHSSQGVNSDTHGFTIGGGGSNASSPGLLNKFAFSTGVTAVEWGYMANALDRGGSSCTPSGHNHGYILSGQLDGGSSGQTPKSYRFSYASIATHTYIGDLGYSSVYNTPNQY